MEIVRCKHFSVEVEEIYVSGAPVMLRVPIRRCALAERMIGYIAKTARGRSVALKLRIASRQNEAHAAAYGVDLNRSESGVASSEMQAEFEEETIRAAFGPDLEAIHHLECTAQRCKESCTPSYRWLLEHFDLHDLAEQETGVGCLGTGE
jgi:hypothetical protein